MKWIRSSVVVMGLLAIFLVVGSLIMGSNPEYQFYTRPEFLVVCALLLLVQILCLIRYRFHWRKIGFYVCHIGVVVVIVGAFVSHWCMQEVNFQIPVNAGAAYNIVQKDDGSVIDFGFQISVRDFDVQYYDAEYQVYRPDSQSETGYSLYRDSVSLNRNGLYEIGGGYQDVTREQVMDGTEFRSEVETADGLLLIRLPQADRRYEANMRILGDEVQDVLLQVNHPVLYDGWKFYLMDYDREAGSYVTLYAKNDPGNLPIRIGIWMLLIGTVLMCFRILEKKGEENHGIH